MSQQINETKRDTAIAGDTVSRKSKGFNWIMIGITVIILLIALIAFSFLFGSAVRNSDTPSNVSREDANLR